ncbi:cell division protein FtsB [Nitrosovibrio sp. Nv4]|nr:cell division protein FtsB [Nitrosovibrio sp. Nv4]
MGKVTSSSFPRTVVLRDVQVKVLSFILTALIVLLQYPLWLGKGSWLKVWEVDQQVMTQHEINQKLKSRNAALDAEVRDLKQGYEAIEERARSELGMIKEDEVFFHITEDNEKSLSQADKTGDGKL